MNFTPFGTKFSLFDDFYEDVLEPEPIREVICPKCKRRLSDVLDTMFVGCPECYNVFAPYIKDMALRYHGKCVHVGKTIDANKSKAKLEQELAGLAQEEKQAVLDRDYLKADEIKRKIKSLRGQN